MDHALARSWELIREIEAEYEKKIRKYGIKIVDLTPAETEKAKQLVYKTEWPYVEKLLGPELMARVKKAAGVK